MTEAPSPAFDIPAELGQVFEKFIVAEFAYFTPKGEPLCWPVSPYWYPERGVLAISTGLAYPNKADYPKINPKVSFYFSDPRGSGIDRAPKVLVQGDATVLDEDIQANSDRYVRELRAKFPIARIGLNPVSVRFLDFYLPRLWVEITPRRIVSTGKVEAETTESRSPKMPSAARTKKAGSALDEKQRRALKNIVESFREAVVTVEGEDGYPDMTRTAISMSDDGSIFLGAAFTIGPAALTFHRHALRGTRFKAYMARGNIVSFEGGFRFEPSRLAGFFGNGAVFPFSVIPEVGKLRRRLHKELSRRNQPMPKLRIPR